MIEVSLRDGLYALCLVVGITGSHFTLRTQVMILEERMQGHYQTLKRIFDLLERIEMKLDRKQDK